MRGPNRVTINLETTLPPLLEGGKWSPANISSGRKACPHCYQQHLGSGPTVCEREIPTSHTHSCGRYKHTLQQWAHMRGAWSCSSHGAGAVQQLLSSLPTLRPLVPAWGVQGPWAAMPMPGCCEGIRSPWDRACWAWGDSGLDAVWDREQRHSAPWYQRDHPKMLTNPISFCSREQGWSPALLESANHMSAAGGLSLCSHCCYQRPRTDHSQFPD